MPHHDLIPDPPRRLEPPRLADIKTPGLSPTARDVADVIALLAAGADHAIEVRAPKCRRVSRAVNVVSRFPPGAFEAAAREALDLSGTAPAVYIVMNGVGPDMPAGRNPRDGGAKATDIPRRLWLLIDSDPSRPADSNATDAEKDAAYAVVMMIRDWLTARGFPEPVVADSGNGYHLLYRIDLLNDDDATALVKAVLAALAARFDSAEVKVDRKVFDPPRLVKLYGTLAAKGEDTPERPHRYARVLAVPAELKSVPVEQLRALAAEAPAPADVGPATAAEGGQGLARAQATRGDARGTHDAESRAIAYLARCDPAVSGQRGHDKAFKAACAVGPGFDLPPDVALRLLRTHYNPDCDPPWSEGELRHKVDDAYKVEKRRGWLLNAPLQNGAPLRNGHTRGPEPARPRGKGRRPAGPAPRGRFELTDLGNAERLVAAHGHALRYCKPWGEWLEWDGRRWREDRTGAVERRAKETVRLIHREADGVEDKDERQAIFDWAVASESRKRIDAMIALARSEAGVAVVPEELNADPWLFNCLSGTINLRTGELRPHDPADLITKLANAEYHPGARCPRWEQFEREVFAGDDEVIGYVRRKLGYSLTGLDQVQELDILFGDGANGKSVFLDTILSLLGDYACQAAPDLLMAKDGSDHPTGIADLDGRRFVAASETESGRRLAEALVKRLTGDKLIKGRRMRQDFYEFARTFKVFLACNHKPRIRGSDHAIWRRIKLVPFRVKFVGPGEAVAPPLVLPAVEGLTEQLVGESPGILALLVEACLDWQRGGMRTPESVEAATDGYRREMDVIGDFIADRCTAQEGLQVKASALYAAYRKWCEDSGIKAPLSLRDFGSEMERRGFVAKHTNSGNFRQGLGLNASEGQAARGEGW
jgi:P4 family phage/plasmid primase-like protien